MCKVGGPRCNGSHTPSTTQRAKRKANTAYRNAVAEAVLTNTGDEELAARVKKASMTDMHDIVSAAGLNADGIAKQCGTQTYTSPDGETATVDVEPAGTVRRSPVTDETRQLLEDIDDAMQTLPAGPYHDAVLSGDREQAEKSREAADTVIANTLADAENLDLDTASDEEIRDVLDKMEQFDTVSMAMRGHGYDFDEHEDSQRVKDKLTAEMNRREAGTEETITDDDPTVFDDDYFDVDGVRSGTITVTEDNADEVSESISDELAATDITGLTDEEFEELYERMDTLDDKLRAAGHDGVYELASLADEYDYRNQDEDDKYEFGDEYQRHNQITNWAYDAARDHQPEGMDFGMWRAAQYLENSDYYNGSDVEAKKWSDEVLKSPESYDKFEVGVAQNVADKQEWKSLKEGSKDISAMSDAQVEDYTRRLGELTSRMNNDDSPLLSGDYQADREIRDLEHSFIEEKFNREEARANEEKKVSEKNNVAGSGSGGSGSGSEDEPESEPADGTVGLWPVGQVVWAPTKGDVFARVVSITEKTVTLEQLECEWDAPGKGKQTYSPGQPTGKTYRRQVQRAADGSMTCKAGPTKSTARMQPWG